MAEAEHILEIEIVYALPHTLFHTSLIVSKGTTIQEALEQSKIFEQFPELRDKKIQVGIFGMVVELSHEVKTGERIEVYRPLKISPKERRLKKLKT